MHQSNRETCLTGYISLSNASSLAALFLDQLRSRDAAMDAADQGDDGATGLAALSRNFANRNPINSAAHQTQAALKPDHSLRE
jgi:hypothetical protein